MAVATADDVAVALGRPITAPTEIAQVEHWLNGIEIIVKSRLGELSSLDESTLRYVEVEAVAAKVRRSGTLESSITVAVDDGSVTRRYETPVGAGDVTDEWWDLLNPSTASDAFTVTPFRSRQSLVGDGCWDA